MPTPKLPYAVIHHFPGGTKRQYAAILAAVHPGKRLPKGMLFHAAGPVPGGWTIMGAFDSKKSWLAFHDKTLMPAMKAGIKGGFATPPQESTFAVQTFLT